MSAFPWQRCSPARLPVVTLKLDHATGRPVAVPSARPKRRRGDGLVCGQCGLTITDRREAITVDGSHEHVFENPYGVVFRLGCFRQAPGCALVGPATEAYTWFAGHTWAMAHCRRCGVHLGWYYQGSDDSFFGLILNRLVESS